MRREYYWYSHENAAYNRSRLANPASKTMYRFKRAPAGNGFALLQKSASADAITNAPGYATALYLTTGDIVHFTESFRDSDTRPLFRDAQFVGEFDTNELVILQHADGFSAKYQIGTGGIAERELTVYQAKWLEEACAAAKLPMPVIDGYTPQLPDRTASAG